MINNTILNNKGSIAVLELIDFKSGKITYNEFNIDFNKTLKMQSDYLKEDLLQVEYDTGYIIDLGWYPELDENGCFVVYVIRKFEWHMPVFEKRAYIKRELKQILEEAIGLICG